MVDLRMLVSEHKELIIKTRRDLHRIPEVGYTEEKTSAYVADYLKREGLEVKTTSGMRCRSRRVLMMSSLCSLTIFRKSTISITS